MTLPEFLEKLAQTPRDWGVDEFDGIRRPHGAGYQAECPITSLRKRPAGYFDTCAIALGLSVSNKRLIQQAADGTRQCDQELRAKLLKACGLEAQS